MKIGYPSSRFPPDEAFRVYIPQFTRDQFVRSIDDLVDATGWGLAQRITPKVDFDSGSFLNWLQAQRDTAFSSDEDLRNAVHAAIETEKALRACMDPWDQLQIDWSEMHETARAILDQPKDWSRVEDFSPHGSDTGADIFNAWGDYENLDARQAARRIGWEQNEIDFEDELFWQDWVKINLALAFGHIKKSGTCHPALASAAFDVLTTDLRRVEAKAGWKHKDQYLEKMSRFADILTRFK